MTSAGSSTKTASTPFHRGRRFVPRNVFVESMSKIGSRPLQELNPHQELHDLHRDMREAVRTLSEKAAGAEGSARLAMVDLCEMAKSACQQGHTVSEVLLAAVSQPFPLDQTSQKVAEGVAADLARELLRSGFRAGESAEKVASRPNPNHPVALAFKKVAGHRKDMVVSRAAHEELRAELGRLTAGIGKLA